MSTVAAEAGWQYVLQILRDKGCRTAAAAQDIASWLRHCEDRDLRDSTVLAYEKRVTPLLRMFPDTKLKDFTHLQLEAVINRAPRGSKRPTVTAFNSLFRWAKRRRLIEEDPTEYLDEIRPPKQKYTETFTEAEVEALTGLPGEDGLRMLLMFDTGLRIGELCALRVRDVQVARSQLVVLDGKGGKDRVIPLTGRLLQAFSDWSLVEAVKPEDFVFGHRKPGGSEGILHRRDPLTTDALRNYFYKTLEQAGVRKLRPHATRHTFATTLLRRDASVTKVAKMLGHSSSAVTEEAYSHLVTEDLHSLVELLEA